MWWWGFGCGRVHSWFPTQGSPETGRFLGFADQPAYPPWQTVAIESPSTHKVGLVSTHTSLLKIAFHHTHAKLFFEGHVCVVFQAGTVLSWLHQGGLGAINQLLSLSP